MIIGTYDTKAGPMRFSNIAAKKIIIHATLAMATSAAHSQHATAHAARYFQLARMTLEMIFAERAYEWL